MKKLLALIFVAIIVISTIAILRSNKTESMNAYINIETSNHSTNVNRVSTVSKNSSIYVTSTFSNGSMIEKFNKDGSKDDNFTPIDFRNRKKSHRVNVLKVVEQSNGNLVILGKVKTKKYNYFISRYKSSGKKDNSFKGITDSKLKISNIGLDKKNYIYYSTEASKQNDSNDIPTISINFKSLKDNGSLNKNFNFKEYTYQPFDNSNQNIIKNILIKNNKITIYSLDQLFRMNLDGSEDSTFKKLDLNNPRTDSDKYIENTLITSDNKILYQFSGINMHSSPLRRLNWDGSEDRSFNTNTESGDYTIGDLFELKNNSYILAQDSIFKGLTFLAFNKDGNLLNNNYTINTKDTQTNVIKLNNRVLLLNFSKVKKLKVTQIKKPTNINPSFKQINKVLDPLYTSKIEKYDDGYIVQSKKSLFKIKSNGELDNSFKPIFNTNDEIIDFLVTKDNKVLYATSTSLTKLSRDGQIDTSFNECAYNPEYDIKLAQNSNGDVFISYSNTGMIAKMSSDCVQYSTFLHPKEKTTGLAIDNKNNIIVSSKNSIVRYLPNAEIDPSFKKLDTKQIIGGFGVSSNGDIFYTSSKGNLDYSTKAIIKKLNHDGSENKEFKTVNIPPFFYHPKNNYLPVKILVMPDNSILVGLFDYKSSLFHISSSGIYDKKFEKFIPGFGNISNFTVGNNGEILITGVDISGFDDIVMLSNKI